VYVGCTDPTPPLKDAFLSLPYELYFAGECERWGGGHVCVMPDPIKTAHTIARAYLITVSQFEEIAAEQSGRRTPSRLPIKQAMRSGHATINDGTGDYEELVYCGMREGYPMFTLTATTPHTPYVAPSPAYTRLVLKGLSENQDISAADAIEYMYTVPGVAGRYQKQDVTTFFEDASEQTE
jgi:hypothetical protein